MRRAWGGLVVCLGWLPGAVLRCFFFAEFLGVPFFVVFFKSSTCYPGFAFLVIFLFWALLRYLLFFVFFTFSRLLKQIHVVVWDVFLGSVLVLRTGSRYAIQKLRAALGKESHGKNRLRRDLKDCYRRNIKSICSMKLENRF